MGNSFLVYVLQTLPEYLQIVIIHMSDIKITGSISQHAVKHHHETSSDVDIMKLCAGFTVDSPTI